MAKTSKTIGTNQLRLLVAAAAIYLLANFDERFMPSFNDVTDNVSYGEFSNCSTNRLLETMIADTHHEMKANIEPAAFTMATYILELSNEAQLQGIHISNQTMLDVCPEKNDSLDPFEKCAFPFALGFRPPKNATSFIMDNGDWSVKLESLLKSMLVTECQMLAQNSKNDLNDAPLVVEEEVKRGCKSLLKGQQLSVDGPKIVGTVTLACQTDGQQMVADLKQWEIDTKKITVFDGLQSAVAEGILPQANEHSKKLLQQFVTLINFLGVVENKMSAGLAKDAIHAVLTQKSLPSEMMQLVIQLWLKVFNGGEHQTEAVQQKQQHQHVQQSHPPGDHLQKRHEFPVRRRRRRQERMLSTARIFRELGTLGMFGDFLRHKMFLILAAIGLYAYLRQHPRFQQWNERN
uniref:Uncharacterized protein n=1 Tax=Globodera rostochiensis TaxID=31243 RepID=A0A914ICC8_GLORO